MTPAESPVVLVIEDDEDVAETFRLWLREAYDVRLAHSGSEGLERLDESVDVVLLDRMMPGMSGDEVLEEIRERDLDVQVAMVTAVDPDFDIIEMGFDDYVTKPPSREELREVVADLLERDDYEADLREYHSLVDTRAALQAEKSEAELAASEEYAELESRIDALRERIDEGNDRLLDDAAFVATLRDVAGESDGGAEGGDLS